MKSWSQDTRSSRKNEAHYLPLCFSTILYKQDTHRSDSWSRLSPPPWETNLRTQETIHNRIYSNELCIDQVKEKLEIKCDNPWSSLFLDTGIQHSQTVSTNMCFFLSAPLSVFWTLLVIACVMIELSGFINNEDRLDWHTELFISSSCL